MVYTLQQVDEWYPELIEVEEQAKEVSRPLHFTPLTHSLPLQAASRLLYVIDDQTRAVASMIEAADFVGSSRDVLVVVNDITGDAPMIGGDRLSRREVEDLNRGRAFVRSITDKSGCLVEETVQEAVTALVDVSYTSTSV